MESIYDYINVLPFDDQGWWTPARSEILPNLLEELKVQTIIEVGSWKGESTIKMAELIDESGKIFAIDNWLGFKDYGSEYYEPKIDYIYGLFLSNIKQKNLTHKIVPIRMTSKEACKMLNITADLILLDANCDDEEIYKDLERWHPKLNEKGVICGDNYNGWYKMDVVHRYALEHNLIVNFHHGFWWLKS